MENVGSLKSLAAPGFWLQRACDIERERERERALGRKERETGRVVVCIENVGIARVQ